MPDLDDRDRKLLTLLADDASPSYAELGKLLNLSAPAVHERVKRLKRDGLIKGIAARLDSVKFDGFMTFELTTASKPGRHENDAYARMEPQEYIAQAYMRACRAAALRKG